VTHNRNGKVTLNRAMYPTRQLISC
jgi:hypothetical protein